MSATVIARSQPTAALFGQKAGVIACFLGWICQSWDAHCNSTLDPRLAGCAGLSARFSWRTERFFMIDRAAVLTTEACGDRRLARQILELDRPGVLADFQNAGRS